MTTSTTQSRDSSATSDLPVANTVDHTDPVSFERFLTGIAAAFTSAPLSRAFITEIDVTPPPYPSPTINPARIRQHFTPGITKAASENAILLESGDYSALAVWETTTYRGVPFAERSQEVGPIRGSWRERVRGLKAKHIGTRVNEQGREEMNPHYTLDFLARNPNAPHVEGAVTAVVKPILEEAVKEGVAVWLQATYEHAVEVYEHFGFRTVEVVRAGVGSRNEEGWPEEGGNGARGWAMILDQHLPA